ncbi:MAG: hypothetical protein AAF658_20490, partial [Myxococcota bacterium]
GFDVSTTRRWPEGGQLSVGVDVSSFASDLDVFARIVHPLTENTFVTSRAEYDLETGVYGGALELIHSRGRHSLVFHAGASSEPYRVERFESEWPINDFTRQWDNPPPLTVSRTEDEVRYRIGLGYVVSY